MTNNEVPPLVAITLSTVLMMGVVWNERIELDLHASSTND